MTTVHVALNTPAGTDPGWSAAGGTIVFTPLERHTVGDEVIVPAPFTATLDEAGEWTGVLVGGWLWRAVERVPGGTVRHFLVDDDPGTVEYADLVDVDPSTLGPSPAAEAAWEIEAAMRVAGDAARIAGAAVSTDGSFSLPAPTGAGLEFVMADDGLDDIRWNGASL